MSHYILAIAELPACGPNSWVPYRGENYFTTYKSKAQLLKYYLQMAER